MALEFLRRRPDFHFPLIEECVCGGVSSPIMDSLVRKLLRLLIVGAVVSFAQNTFLVAMSGRGSSPFWLIAAYSLIEVFAVTVMYVVTCVHVARVRLVTRQPLFRLFTEHLWPPAVFGFFISNPSLFSHTPVGYFLVLGVGALAASGVQQKYDILKTAEELWPSTLEGKLFLVPEIPRSRLDVLALDFLYVILLGIAVAQRLHTDFLPP